MVRRDSNVESRCWVGTASRFGRAIEINGESQAGSNPDARFARGLDNLTIRPLNSSLPPDEHWVDILYRAKNGVVASHREYWLVHKTSDVAESSTPHSQKRAAMDLKRTRILEVKKKLYPRDDSATLGSIKDVLYALKKTVNGQTFGYIRLFSFDVDDARKFLKAFTRLITKDGFPQEGLILDVRGNPGGNIRAAESLLQLLTPQRIEPELFEFINTPLNFQICKSAPDQLGSETMAAIDRRLGVDGCDLFRRISAHPRRLVQRHRSGLLRSGRAHHRRAVVQRDGHLRRRFSGQSTLAWCSARAGTPERGEPTSGRSTICCGRRRRIPSLPSRSCRREPR